MNTLRDLHEAFHELELRADAVEAPSEPLVRHHSARRLVAPAASVAAVAAVALTVAGVTVWHDGSGSPSGTTVAGNSGGAAQPTQLVSQPVAQTTPTLPGFQPPPTPAALAAKARSVLAGIATIDVTDGGYNVQMTLPSGMRGGDDHGGRVALPNSDNSNGAGRGGTLSAGAGISGTLTADGRTGGFDLDVYYQPVTGHGTVCDNADTCRHHVSSDGSVVWASTWRGNAGGLTQQVEIDRADGAVISMHLSTTRDPKGGGPAITSQLPLTVQQMTDVVSSDQW
jgi:hypothetical protein